MESDQGDAILQAPEGVGPRHISGAAVDDPTLLSKGVVTRLHGLYAGLPYGRLVILGGPGAGKTSAAILLLLAALRHRESRLTPERNGIPVPVMLTLDGWDPSPEGESLRRWAAARIYRDHPYLDAEGYGPKVVERLFNGGAIALFLDGLDEMPATAQAAAAWRIAQEAELRIVLMSRPKAYDNATDRSYLPNVVVVTLQPVGADQTSAYLRQVSSRGEALAAHLKAHPSGPLAQILSTPLALALLRSTYRETGDPFELTDTARFPTADSIWVHLLDGLMIAAYPNARRRAQARRWLGFLANQMNQDGERDLAWWRIPAWRAWQTRLAGGLAIGLIIGLVAGLVRGLLTGLDSFFRELPETGFAYGLNLGMADGFDMGSVTALLAAVAGWIVAALVSGRRLSSPPRDVTPRWPSARDIASGLIVGGVAGLLIGLVLALSLVVERRSETSLQQELESGLGHELSVTVGIACGAGLVAGLVAGVGASWLRPTERSGPGRTPQTAFARDLRATAISAIAGGLVGSVVGWVFASRTGGGLLTGLVFGGLLLGVAVTFILGPGPSIWLIAVAPLHRLVGRGPFLAIRFLEAARKQQVLRQSGAMYQFRHAKLQDRLAKSYRDASSS
jgi:predicted lipid-binding transport protein (Tim44 family)